MPRKTMPDLSQAIHVKRTEGEPEAVELIAASIIECAAGFERMRLAGLQERAIVLLLHEMTGVPKGHIVKILNAGPRLAQVFVSPWKVQKSKEGK